MDCSLVYMPVFFFVSECACVQVQIVLLLLHRSSLQMEVPHPKSRMPSAHLYRLQLAYLVEFCMFPVFPFDHFGGGVHELV